MNGLPTRYVSQVYARAFSLDRLGRYEEAREAFKQALQDHPDHPQALRGTLALTRLLLAAGHRPAVRDLLMEAVEKWPLHADLQAELATVLVDLEQPDAARRHYQKAIELEPDSAHAHSGLATLLWREGETEGARRHGRLGFGGRANARPFRGAQSPVPLLLVYSATGGGVPIEHFADDRVFLNWVLICEFADPSIELPPHDLAFNCIGDADLCPDALDAAEAVLSRSSAPILNPPQTVRRTSRRATAERLGKLPGVVTARFEMVSRQRLLEPDAAAHLSRLGFRWPLLLRSPGCHLGRNFLKVDSPMDLLGAVQSLPGEGLLVIEFIDTRSRDGNFRKYRAMMVNGELFPLHLAVSSDWKVHYFSAQMAENADYRAEDEAYLQDLAGSLGPRAYEALQRVAQAVGLDYGGIDFGLDAAGNLVVFEANAVMFFDKPELVDYGYMKAPYDRVREAVFSMLLKRAGHSMEVV